MRKVLVVVDMQNDFVDGVLGSPEAQTIVDNVVKKIESFNGEIIVTYDTHDENYMSNREGKYLPVPHCIIGTEGHRLNNKVSAALDNKGYELIYKPTFGSTELVDVINDFVINEKDTEVTLVGLCTDICVISNAMLLKAFYPEMDITIDATCCAGVTPESHKAALLTMKMCQINIVGEEG